MRAGVRVPSCQGRLVKQRQRVPCSPPHNNRFGRADLSIESRKPHGPQTCPGTALRTRTDNRARLVARDRQTIRRFNRCKLRQKISTRGLFDGALGPETLQRSIRRLELATVCLRATCVSVVEVARRTGRFLQLVDQRGRVNGLLLKRGPIDVKSALALIAS